MIGDTGADRLGPGRASAKLTSDIGAIESGRWHASHLSWKIGAMSLVNVGAFAAAAAGAVCALTEAAVNSSAPPITNKARFMIPFLQAGLKTRLYITT